MPDIEIQFENSKTNRDELLGAIFGSNGWSLGMQKEIPGGAQITLQRVPLGKGIGTESLITLVLSFGTGVASSVVANWLSSRFFTHRQTKVWINRTEVETTPEGLSKIIRNDHMRQQPRPCQAMCDRAAGRFRLHDLVAA